MDVSISQLVKALRCNATPEECQVCPFTDADPEVFCHSDDIHLQAADKLEQLQGLVDDMLGDHDVDYLAFYTNRCRDLEEQSAAQFEDIRTLAIASRCACDYCKHHQHCKSKDCQYYIDGKDLESLDGYMFDWQRSCEDLEYGECPMLAETPCHKCTRNNYRGFEYKGM